MQRLLAVVFWSVLAAAFIGPGTVTTCAAAGAGHGVALAWALSFSTFACIVLQEAAARLTVASGQNLGQALRRRFHGGLTGAAMLGLVLAAIVVGCAAYQAGNVLGGVAGAALAVDWPRPVLTLLCGLGAGLLLWLGAPKKVAVALSLLVALMGIAFLATAILLRPDPVALLVGSVLPSLPPGSGLLALGLVGTTVVPYNLFLGSGLAAGQDLRLVRFGLAVAIGLGGLISLGILVVGTAVEGPFGFVPVAAVLTERLGPWASHLFAAGLWAAGFSSAVTAPLAAAMTAQALFGDPAAPATWHHDGWRFRAVWAGVLLVGIGFGLAEVAPIPAILLAQAANGVLLPFVAVFLLLAVNDRRLMGPGAMNGPLANTLGIVTVFITLVLGAAGLFRAAARTFGLAAPSETTLLGAGLAVALVLAIPLTSALLRLRAG